MESHAGATRCRRRSVIQVPPPVISGVRQVIRIVLCWVRVARRAPQASGTDNLRHLLTAGAVADTSMTIPLIAQHVARRITGGTRGLRLHAQTAHEAACRRVRCTF